MQRQAKSTNPLVPRNCLPIAALAALFVGCTLESSSSGGVVTPPQQETLSKSWYVSDCEITFDEDAGTYEVANFIGGFYQLTEVGSFIFDGVPGTLYGFPLADLMGSLGLSDNGDPFQLEVLGMSASTLVFVDSHGNNFTLSEFAPLLEDPPIEDNFEDAELDQRWWTLGDASISDGKLHLQGASTAVGLWQLGFTKIRAHISLQEVQGQSNVALGYRPWDEDILAKCGVGVSDLGNTTVFAQVYDQVSDKTLFYADLLDTGVGVTHECRMVWTGNRIEFYADGVMLESYTPTSSGNFEFCGEPCLFAWGEGVYGTIDDFQAL